MQDHFRPVLTKEFFDSLRTRSLPRPTEAADNFIEWMADQAEGMPGKQVSVEYTSEALLSEIGVVTDDDILWIVQNLEQQGLIRKGAGLSTLMCNLTASGWLRYEELKRAHVSSNYAFFARKFSNVELDHVFEKCLRQAVNQTGYELRMVTQRAGLVDAIIEDEIRRCRFLIADLSDDNAGAYWEAGFAEGLGKPVIYICRATDGGSEKKTHFDANHRQTVRWDLASLDLTAAKLKAVIRNTLLGDARQMD